jgi:hypothetical protein
MSENKVQNPVTAMDIVLEPDATMIERAQGANAALRKNFPKGYSLDEEHRPHISVMGGLCLHRESGEDLQHRG